MYYRFYSLDSNKLIYSLDFIVNHRVYMPKYFQLNDAMEGYCRIKKLAVCGGGYYYGTSYIPSIIHNRLSEFRIISFTKNWDSPLMWSLYANNFNGFCVALKDMDEHLSITKINYVDKFKEIDFEDECYNENIHNLLLYKKNEWSYENEYRHLEKTENKYLQLSIQNIDYILIGCNTDMVIADIIKKMCDLDNIKVKYVYPSVYTNKIEKVEFDEYHKKYNYNQ